MFFQHLRTEVGEHSARWSIFPLQIAMTPQNPKIAWCRKKKKNKNQNHTTSTVVPNHRSYWALADDLFCLPRMATAHPLHSCVRVAPRQLAALSRRRGTRHTICITNSTAFLGWHLDATVPTQTASSLTREPNLRRKLREWPQMNHCILFMETACLRNRCLFMSVLFILLSSCYRDVSGNQENRKYTILATAFSQFPCWSAINQSLLGYVTAQKNKSAFSRFPCWSAINQYKTCNQIVH